ncbi:MAG: T9SS type A sorting domain-containing protein [Syntrophothermus sp.]
MKKLIVVILLFSCTSAFSQSVFDSTWTNYFRRNFGGWTAGDATLSVKLPDNRVIWLFGDSYTVPVNPDNTLPCLFQVRNCFMVQDSVDRNFFKTILDTTMTGVNMTTFKLVPNDTALFWPGAGYVRNDTVFIFLERYQSTTLAYLGCYLVKLHFPDLAQIGIYRVNTPIAAIFGRAVVPDEAAGKLYLYGNKLNWIVWEPVLARCDINNPLSRLEYYTGNGWSVFSSDMQKISDEPVSPGFTVFPYQNRYVLVTQENGYLECGLGREIYSMDAMQPQGPFGSKKLLYTEESTFNNHYLLTYNAQAHPWNIENNELLIGYNVNDRVDTLDPYVCPSECVNIFTDRMDADSYRPKFIRVPMDMIVSAEDLPGIFDLTIYPNPVHAGKDLRFSFHTGREEKASVRIFDLSGRIICEKSKQCVSGQNNFSLPAPASPGCYLLELQTRNGIAISKFLVY